MGGGVDNGTVVDVTEELSAVMSLDIVPCTEESAPLVAVVILPSGVLPVSTVGVVGKSSVLVVETGEEESPNAADVVSCSPVRPEVTKLISSEVPAPASVPVESPL